LDEEQRVNRWETQLRKGVVELAVLASIERGETYGYRIVEQLQTLKGLELTESTVYPVLTRLARDGFLAVRADVSPSGPTRRYYRLTAVGNQHLRQLAESWRRISQSLSALIEGV
jgi:PadR family transcriptional regulator, regulatory protein PadR